jgi:hypothetical protein
MFAERCALRDVQRKSVLLVLAGLERAKQQAVSALRLL